MDSARQQLADEMDRRRKQLRIRWNEVAKRAGMTPQNLLRIRNGEIALTDFAAGGIEQALEWPDGHIAAWLASRSGPDPASRQDVHRAIQVDIERMTPARLDEMTERVSALMGEDIAREWRRRAVELQRASQERQEPRA